MERIQMHEIILLLNINVQPTRANARLQFQPRRNGCRHAQLVAITH